MIDALEVAGLLDRLDVERFFDDADNGGSRRASVQIAHGSTSVMLLHTEQRKIFVFTSRIAAASVSASAGRAFEDVIREPLRRLAADAGKLGQLIDEVVARGGGSSRSSNPLEPWDLHAAGHRADR